MVALQDDVSKGSQVAERKPMAKLKIVVVHGEQYSLFHVVDEDAPEEEQPAILANFRNRGNALRWMVKERDKRTKS